MYVLPHIQRKTSLFKFYLSPLSWLSFTSLSFLRSAIIINTFVPQFCICLPVLGCVILWIIVCISVKCICYNSVSASICMFPYVSCVCDSSVIVAVSSLEPNLTHSCGCLSTNGVKQSLLKVQRELTVSMTGTSTKRYGTKGPWEGQLCLCAACWSVEKRGRRHSRWAPPGVLKRRVRPCSLHTHSTYPERGFVSSGML